MKLSESQRITLQIALELEKLRPAIEAYGFDLREDRGISVFTYGDGTMYSQLFYGADTENKFYGYGIPWYFPMDATAKHIGEDVAVLIDAACADFKRELEMICPRP